MALILIEGFSDTSTEVWDYGSSIAAVLTSGSRLPGGAYGYGTPLIKSFTASTMVVMGFGANPSDSTSDRAFVSFYGDDGATEHITVLRNPSTERIEIRLGSSTGTLLATSTEIVRMEKWSYIEMSVSISSTVGEVHVRLNGAPTDAVNFTGNTKNGGTNDTIDKIVGIFDKSYGNAFYLCDMYLLNDSGSTNNTFLGDVGVRPLRPNGNGNSSQLTGSDADQVDNYLLVDEIPHSGSDYAGSATSGDKDTYTMSDLPTNTSIVHGVRVRGAMYKGDAGYAQSRLIIRSGGTDYASDTLTLSTSTASSSKLYEQDPATAAAWTVSGVNSAEAGMEVM